MECKLLMGNQAIAVGAMEAGIEMATGYPGTPATEIIETIAKEKRDDIYVEWSVNEKVALEVAIGASYSGKRCLVTMKQMGLNVCADPIMTLSYIGVNGGLVIVVADDPGPISSQTEQDTRLFAQFSKIPIFDPSTPEEAYKMIKDAFDYSEKYKTPVIFRPTTRVCHSYSTIECNQIRKKIESKGFIKKNEWIIMPNLSYKCHLKVEEREKIISKEFDKYKFNSIEGEGKVGIAASGVSYVYVKEALDILNIKPEKYRLFKVSTAYPFPAEKAIEFLDKVDNVLVFEELDPVVEKQLIYLCGKNNILANVCGKLTGHVKHAGENTVDEVKSAIENLFKLKVNEEINKPINLPIRKPEFCAGCPHRASLYCLKVASKGRKTIFAGDIGCYTLGFMEPINVTDTCLCMGACIGMAQGFSRSNDDTLCFSLIGDSTFFHSGITGIVNAVYNKANIIVVILDNDTTAMTGYQQHPGTGFDINNNQTERVKMEEVLKGCGVSDIAIIDPFDMNKSINIVKDIINKNGVRVIISRAQCASKLRSKAVTKVNKDLCTKCQRCITEIGCPAMTSKDKEIIIDEDLCNGCGLCNQVCSNNALQIVKG